MNRNPYVPPEAMADYLKSSGGAGACTAQTCHVTEKAAPADDAGAQAANATEDKPAAIPAKKKPPAGRRKARAAKK